MSKFRNQSPLVSIIVIWGVLSFIYFVAVSFNRDQTPSSSDGLWQTEALQLKAANLELAKEIKSLKNSNLISAEDVVYLRAQNGQDRYMYENFFHNLGRPGIYIEFGARDGISESNTYFYEKVLGWKGLMVEVMEAEYKQLVKNRPNTLTINGAICPKPGFIQFSVSQIGGWHGIADSIPEARKDKEAKLITVPCYILNDVIEKAGFKRIDWMSVDTEGSEYDVLAAFDFGKVIIDYIQVECLTFEKVKMEKIINLMESRGYELFNSFVVADDTRDLMFRRTQKLVLFYCFF
ncbi:hypothetical protein HK099_000417 [Clydaea vesicula]|uniref:Methyltransferase FkbM domain-containing protein n=1 Tax=Clydaea vesicula TaxID=447962 RepID=A0AAD5XZD7_9FUNG|nr:hypothetical protein HK099_000417 [Clydaea vesicula]